MLNNGDQRIKQSLISSCLVPALAMTKRERSRQEREKYNQINDLLWIGPVIAKKI